MGDAFKKAQKNARLWWVAGIEGSSHLYLCFWGWRRGRSVVAEIPGKPAQNLSQELDDLIIYFAGGHYNDRRCARDDCRNDPEPY